MVDYQEVVLLYLYFVNFMTISVEEIRKLGRRWWVHEYNLEQTRELYGAFNQAFMYFKYNDCEKFYNYLHMTTPQFQYILDRVAVRLTKHSWRMPLDPQLRLAITLHYLAHGEDVEVLAQFFRIGRSTLYSIIPEVCEAIYDTMKQSFFSIPQEQAEWLTIADDFYNLWDLPNCLGAIDTRQFKIQKPPHSGSLFWNYNHNYTLGDMTACDAHKRFLWANVGSYGSLNDAGVFNHCDLRTRIEQGFLNSPPPRLLPGSNTRCPFFFIGDAGFTLYPYLITPYARMLHLLPSQLIFNHRLSRARRIIECAFALLVEKWRVFSKPLAFLLSTSETIILATMTLHNFLIHSELQIPVENRRYVLEGEPNIEEPDPNNLPDQNNLQGDQIRDLLRNWCVNEGDRHWQYDLF